MLTSKIVTFGEQKTPHAYIEKPTHPKRRKWARWGRYSQWRSLSGHVERIFVHKNWKGGYSQHNGTICHTAEATFDVLRPVFEDCIFSHRADVVWPPLYYYLWGAVKDKCYADKPETIDALKFNISEAIGEIQLHTINNVLKNLTDRVASLYGQPRQQFEWNYFPLLTGRIVLSNKQKNLRKYAVVFF